MRKYNYRCLFFRFKDGWLLVTAMTLLIFSGCNNDQLSSQYTASANALFQSMAASETGINFVNEVVDNKDFNVFKYRNFYNGGGSFRFLRRPFI